jgi:hypothetical protein
MPPTRITNKSRALAELAPPEDFDLAPLATHRAGLLAGDYDAFVGEHLRDALREAAADTDLETEIGALRLALIRVLHEEHDPSRLAVSVARLAAVAVQAAHVRHNPDSERDEIQRTMLRQIQALDEERALEATAQATPAPDLAAR